MVGVPLGIRTIHLVNINHKLCCLSQRTEERLSHASPFINTRYGRTDAQWICQLFLNMQSQVRRRVETKFEKG
jgi:hypothetical protein